VIAQDFAFVEIKQQISCGITMIMGRTAMAPGQTRMERARVGRVKAGTPKWTALRPGSRHRQAIKRSPAVSRSCHSLRIEFT
jgi:hypothetical protein